MIPETFDLKMIQETAEDFDRVAQFYRDAIDQTPEMERFGRWIYGLHPTDGMILDYIRSGVMYTCQGGGEIFCDTAWGLNLEDEQVAVVHLLCVNPKYQHQGIGKRAMAHAIALAEQMGKKAIRLDALSSNTPAHRLYESLDFESRGTAHWFTDNVGWTDFYLFERPL